MAVYIVSLIDTTDPEGMLQYQKNYPALVEAYGGKFLARGGWVEALEGHWDHDRMVVMEFPSRKAALAWYRSPEYRPFIEARQRCGRATLLMVDGVGGDAEVDASARWKPPS